MRRLPLSKSLFVVWLSCGLHLCANELPASERLGALEDQLQRLESEDIGDRDAWIGRWRDELQGALRDLDAFLGQSPSGANWKQFLQWDELQNELQSSQPNWARLERVLDQYYQNHAGLELPPFTRVRESLRRWVRLGRDQEVDRPSMDFDQLRELVRHYQQTGAKESVRGLARAVGNLADVGDSGEVIAQTIRSAHSLPNAHVRLSERFINLLFARDVADVRTIEDTIMGSSVTGVAHTQARVTAGLVPTAEHGGIAVRLQGFSTVPENVAQRRSITIHSSAATTIDATKHVHIDSRGIHLQRAAAECQASISLHDIVARQSFVERLAWRRATRMNSCLEQAAAEKAEVRAARQLDIECDALLGEVDRVFRDEIRAPMIRTGVWPQLDMRTSSQQLHMAVLAANQFQLGAPAELDSVNPQHDIAVYAHESILENFCETLGANGILRDRQFLELMKIVTGESPRPLWVHDRTDPWHVQLAEKYPLRVDFAGGVAHITLAIQQVVRGEQKLERPFLLQVAYQLKVTPHGPHLLRAGELVVKPTSDEALDPEWLRFITYKFGAVFQPSIYFDGLVPPANGSWGKLRQLQVVEFTAEDGWLCLGYQLQTPDGTRVARR